MNAQIWPFDNANALYYALIDALAKVIQPIVAEGRDPVLALPTGNTMIPFYRIAADSEELLKTAHWRAFNLDEYFPITPKNRGESFRNFMKANFYSRLSQPVRSMQFLNGSTHDPFGECLTYEEKLKHAGGIDICILGLGVNGHIAFNEPGSEFDSRTRIVELHPQTLMANFQARAPISHALTMGIGTIMSSRKIFVIAHGKNKANAVKAALTEVASRTMPATILKSHPDVIWFLDQEASSLI